MPQKILVAEDDVILREILIDKLSGAGYKVFGAEDGFKTLELIRGEHPDLVILDIVLPIKNGIEVLAELRADKTTSRTPVVAISNSTDADTIKQAQAHGVKDFLVKALFDSGDVLDKVKQILSNPNESMPTNQSKNTTLSDDNTSSPKLKNISDKRIFIVEDDRFLREIAVQKLQAEGFVVTSAISGKDAFDYLNINPRPDVILLDLILPGMSGFELLGKIKQNDSLKNIPVIILSNLGQEEDIEKAKKLGAVDYLVKAHFSFAEIIKKIHDIIG
ncbi:MAG TPA: response regulator [Candidatus Paceibacterota bacterium]